VCSRARGRAPRPGRPGPSGTKPGITPEKVAYDKERVAVSKLRTDLGKHKQAAHAADKTGQADAALAAAATHAATPDWPRAMAELASARTACEDGKRFADGFADFLAKRAEANLVLTAAQTSGWTNLGGYPPLLVSADTKAAPATRNYVGAKADCDGIINGLAPFFKQFYVTNVKPQIAALKALPAARFIASRDRRDRGPAGPAGNQHHRQAVAQGAPERRPDRKPPRDGREDRQAPRRVRARAPEGRRRAAGGAGARQGLSRCRSPRSSSA
jgi:hypothetical protein